MPADACQLLMPHYFLYSLQKKEKKLPNRFPVRRFPIIVPFQISSIAQWQVLADYIGQQPVSSSGTVQVLPPWRSDGRCGPQFPVGKAPGECDPYGGALNLYKFTFKNFLHLFFWICFCSTFQPIFFSKNNCFFRHLRLARCCMLFYFGLVWWLAGFLRMPRLSALLKAGGAPKRREDRARLRVAKT